MEISIEEREIKKKRYIDNLKDGDLVSFTKQNGKTISAKVESINEDMVNVEDKKGKIYKIAKGDILWVKTNGTWPKYIMKKFKGEQNEQIESEQEIGKSN